MLYRQLVPEIFTAIKNANHPLLISHEKPDGDTLGAGLALSHFLHKKAKHHKIFCIDKPPAYFKYLPNIEKVINDYSQINLAEHDLIITIDCADIKRTGLGDYLQGYLDQITIINIDHHQTNNHFGHYNLVIPTASSTSEIVFKFFEHLEIEVDKYIATNLLTGIMTDTMNFTNAATTQESMKIAAKLVSRGAKINQIIGFITQNKSLTSLKLWGKILSRLEFEPQFNFAYTFITLQDISPEISPEDLDGMANFLSLLQDADFVLLLTEEDNNLIKGSLRTTKDTIDVSAIAANLNGGGHRKSAGFKIDRKIIAKNTDWKHYILNVIINKLKGN